MKDSVASVVRAYLDVVILSLLEKGDSYGYAVIREVERVSGGACILQEGPLYIEFRRMEQAGWIRSYWGDETHGARRRLCPDRAGQNILQKQTGRMEADSRNHAGPAGNRGQEGRRTR